MAKHLKGTLILKNENPVIIKQLTKHIEMAPYSLSSVIQFSGSPESKIDLKRHYLQLCFSRKSSP